MTRRFQSYKLSISILVVVACLMPVYGLGAQDPRQEITDDELIATARQIMAAAKFCSLVTLDASGQPQVRTMDPFAPDDDMVVWFGTLRGSRKVAQIRNDSRVALHYPAPEGVGYVSIEGIARIVDDPADKARHWKEEWEEFYPDRDADYVLIAVTPNTLRVLETTQGVMADEETWVVPSVDFSSDDHEAESHIDTDTHEDHLAAGTHQRSLRAAE